MKPLRPHPANLPGTCLSVNLDLRIAPSFQGTSLSAVLWSENPVAGQSGWPSWSGVVGTKDASHPAGQGGILAIGNSPSGAVIFRS